MSLVNVPFLPLEKISDYFELGSCYRNLAQLHFPQPQTSPRGNDIIMDAQSAADQPISRIAERFGAPLKSRSVRYF